jgi:hypothetical protein
VLRILVQGLRVGSGREVEVGCGSIRNMLVSAADTGTVGTMRSMCSADIGNSATNYQSLFKGVGFRLQDLRCRVLEFECPGSRALGLDVGNSFVGCGT